MAITFYPKQNELAQAREAGSIAELASTRPWIVSGLDLGAPVSGLDATITDGRAWIAGFVVDVASEDITVPDAATTSVYLGLVRDGNDNVTGATLATSAHASGDYVVLGTATASGGDITGVATTGRSPETQAEAIPTDADEIDYDNATSGLTATDVQEAIDELAATPVGDGWTGVTGRSTDLSKNNTTFESLVSFAALANKTYLVEAVYFINNAAGGNKFQLTVPTSGAAGLTIHIITDTGSYSGATLDFRFDITAASSQNFNGSITLQQQVTVQGIVTTAGTAGTVAIEVAQQSASGTTVFKAGATLKYKDIT
jgi:hypothetical protein